MTTRSYQHHIVWKNGSLAKMTTRSYSLSLVIIRWTTCYHLVSFVAIRFVLLHHLASLVVTRCITCLSFYKRSPYHKKILASLRMTLLLMFKMVSLNDVTWSLISLRARLHETRSEFKPVWNLKPLWNVVPFTWQFTWRFHCGNFPNNGKALLPCANDIF